MTTSTSFAMSLYSLTWKRTSGASQDTAGRRDVASDFNSKEWRRWEKRCIKRAKNGDREAIAALYNAFARPLYDRILLPKLGDVSAAEDALAETFRTALERLDRFQERGVSIWFWLCRVASNKATDMHRVRARTGRALTTFESLLTPVRAAIPLPGSKSEMDEERALLQNRVRTVLETINPRYRRAIELRFFEERARQDCAATMDVKLGTFDVVLLRALRSFRKLWEAQGANS